MKSIVNLKLAYGVGLAILLGLAFALPPFQAMAQPPENITQWNHSKILVCGICSISSQANEISSENSQNGHFAGNTILSGLDDREVSQTGLNATCNSATQYCCVQRPNNTCKKCCPK